MPVAMTEDAQGVVVSIGPDLYRVGRDYLTPLAFTNGVKPDLYWIINLATGRDGALLVAGVNGICRIKNGVFEQWTLSDGLADNHAAWVFEDTDGTIWAALEKGIVRIRGREIRNISREAGLFDGNICSLVPDDHGNFWADSNRGIFSVSRQELNDFCDGKISHVTCVSYDGLASIKPSDKYGQEQSACRTLDGRIWFPSARGVVMVSTNISLNALPPPVHIASVSANGHEISITNGITIPPGKGELEFQYDALSYIAPREIRFRYQLDGYDHQWVEAKDRRFAVYNNLKPGRYTFHVIAANADGVWSDAGDSLTFKLLPHFYQTVWFYLLDGALVLAALGGIYARRVRYLTNRHRALQQQSRQKMDELESRVAERTKELATSLSLLNATLESTTDGVLAMDLTGKITSFNAKFAAMWQFPAELLKRRDGAETVPYACRQVKDPEKFLEQIKRSQSEPEVETFSLVECKDGRIFERYSQPQRIDNKCVGVVVNWRDITERRKLEEQLRQSQKMDAVGKLAGGVAHDFNNILAVMQMQAGLLKNGGELSNEQVKFIDEISATIQRAADLTRQLLLFSRKKTPQRHDLDLNQLTGNMAKMLGRILGEDIALQLKLSPQPMFVHADAGMMDQVLMNLTVNARDAMPKGGQLLVETSAVEFDESVRAQSATARHGAFVCLSVTDTGCGIPPKILPRIFEPFFTTKDVGKGTGLGLATVFGIVEQHQGWINVYSEVGCGTTFKVYLPRLLTNASQKTAPLAAAPATAGKETILIVEDERPLRAALQMALSRLGYRILEAPSGGAALKVWQEHRTEISLMLTDLMMPDGMSGKELAQRVLQENPKLKVIYMSGYSAEIADKDLILQEGINFLAKPFELHKLAKVIRDSLDKSKAVPLTEPEQLRHSLAIA
jgi:PAS domain S-box-containing protein